MNFNHDFGIIDTINVLDTTTAPPGGGTAQSLSIVGNGALTIPSGTAGQRPGSPVAAMVRYNSDTSSIEFHNGTTWNSLSTGGGTVSSVAVTGSTGLSVSGSPITSSGTITLTLGNELQALSGISTTGNLVRTGSATYALRTISGTASNISVTNGDGVSGNPTIDLVNAGTAVTNQFVKITTDAKGRVTGTTSVASGDITALVDSTYVNVSGDTMSSAANLTFVGGGEVLGLPAVPSTSTAATSKAYVDAVAQGLDPKASVRAATTTNGTLATSFQNGSTIDGVTLSTGDRILIKNQSTQAENGIYVVQLSGAPVRATDADAWTEIPGAHLFVEEGTTLADTGWVCTSNQGGTLGSTAITFVQFSGAGTYTGGTGITITGTSIALSTPVAATNGGTGLSSIGTSNQFLAINTGGSALEYKTVSAGTGISVTPGAGTLSIANTGVTSVGLSAPGIFSVTNSPVTTTGTLTLTLASQSQNTVFVGPTSGSGAPTFRSLVYGDLPLRLYTENQSSPVAPTATGTNSIALGSGSSSTLTGQLTHSSGRFATSGDAQYGLFTLRNITTNATQTELYLDGSSQLLVLPNNSVFTFSALISARRTDATGGGAGYKIEGVARKDATSSSITIIGAVSKSILGETNTAWDATISADTTNGSLSVKVTGEAAKTIRWVATIHTSIVTN